ncbi:MAG: aldo/keto reductase [Sandaracinaceae bacterium]|nr:aldo/keto reductase [Sandaracinaceae bacterium]
MTTRALAGRTVHGVGLGAMNLSWPGPASRRERVRVIEAALDAGAALIDTADVYAPSAEEIGHNERLVRDAARGRDVMVASKGGVVRRGDAWLHDGSPAHLYAACEASLSRLGRIDLYYLHAVDERVPVEESVGALARLRDEGKIGAIGVSNVTRAELERALREAPIAAVQNEASPYRPGGADRRRARALRGARPRLRRALAHGRLARGRDGAPPRPSRARGRARRDALRRRDRVAPRRLRERARHPRRLARGERARQRRGGAARARPRSPRARRARPDSTVRRSAVLRGRSCRGRCPRSTTRCSCRSGSPRAGPRPAA